MLSTPVRAIRPPFQYLGGKRHLADRLTGYIDALPHATYAEVFVGAGGVFFRRRRRPGAEVINDFSRDVTTLFRILQRHYPQFLETLKFQVTTRVEFERLTAVDPDTLTDLERAARFLYLQRTSFGGKISGRNFGISIGTPARFDISRLATLLEEVHARLSGVVIECLRWQEFLVRYDHESTLFYLDPPYWGCENDYGKGLFSRAQFSEMAEYLAALKGRFILSINDTPETSRIFGGFRIERVETLYTVASKSPSPVRELVVTNTSLRSRQGDLLTD